MRKDSGEKMEKKKMTLQEAKDFIENNVQIDIRYCSDEEVNKTKEAFEIAMAALDLVDSQRVKLERFEKIETTLNSFWDELRKLAMLKDKEIPTLEELLEYIDTRVSTAVKNFAEELKNKAAQKCNSEYCAYIDDIDSTVKEWTEEQ